MGDKTIDLYLALSQQCEIITQHPNWNHYVLEQTLIACKDIRVEHLWIGAPGRILQDPCFLVAAQELFELQQRGQVDQLTLQFHATDQVVVSDAPPILRNFSLSLIVCESPLCGVDPPRLIIRTYFRMKSLFRSVSLVGSSPLTCIYGVNAGTGIRRECLVQARLLFVLATGQVQFCPLGHFSPVGDLASESLYSILSRYQDSHLQFPARHLSNPEASRANICAACMGEKQTEYRRITCKGDQKRV